MAARTQRTLLEKKNILKAYENLSTDLTKYEKAKKLKMMIIHWSFKDISYFQNFIWFLFEHFSHSKFLLLL